MWMRLWWLLGFQPPAKSVFTEPAEGLSQTFITSDFVLRIPLRDRFRVLLSGAISVSVASRYDVAPKRCDSKCSFTVLHPGFKIPPPLQNPAVFQGDSPPPNR